MSRKHVFARVAVRWKILLCILLLLSIFNPFSFFSLAVKKSSFKISPIPFYIYYIDIEANDYKLDTIILWQILN